MRCGAYRLLLTRWPEVKQAYATLDLPTWLTGRARELWRPLLAVSRLADDLQLTPDLLELARAHVGDRDPMSAEGQALLTVLQERFGGGGNVRPQELREPLRERLGWRDPPTPEQVAAWLRRLGFPRAGKDRMGVTYTVTSDRLADVQRRYGVTEPSS